MNIPIVKTHVLNPLEVAANVESLARDYLQPPKIGIYMKGSTSPIMVDGCYYFKKDKGPNGETIETPILKIEDIKGNIFNQDAELIIPARITSMVSDEPTVPVQGLKMVSAFVQKHLDDHSAWSRKAPMSLEDVWSDFIKPEYLHTEKTHDLVESIAELMIDIRTDVNHFIGNDKWVMHFMRKRGIDLFVEKSIDYRIHQWSIEHQMELGPDYKL